LHAGIIVARTMKNEGGIQITRPSFIKSDVQSRRGRRVSNTPPVSTRIPIDAGSGTPTRTLSRSKNPPVLVTGLLLMIETTMGRPTAGSLAARVGLTAEKAWK